MGLPLGYLADRGRRTWIVAAGITLWSAATALSGLARNFGQLFIARMSVGVGEATLSPCAMSLISDSYPEERRGKPIAFYSSGISLGSGLASLLGAAVLAWVGTENKMDWPLLGPLSGWQTAFLIVGLPGVVLGVLFLLVREPRRIGVGASGHLGHMFVHIGRNGAVFACFLSVFCVMTTIAYSHGWLAVTFARTYGWAVEEYAFANGMALLIVGPLAVNLAGALSDRFTSRGHRDAPMRIALGGLAVAVPTCIIGPLLDNAWAAFGLLTLGNAGMAFITATSVTALLPITPARIRAQVVAFYYMAISLAGLMLGPTLVGALNDFVFGADGVRYSVALLPLVFGAPVLALAPLTLRLYRRALEQDIGEQRSA